MWIKLYYLNVDEGSITQESEKGFSSEKNIKPKPKPYPLVYDANTNIPLLSFFRYFLREEQFTNF